MLMLMPVLMVVVVVVVVFVVVVVAGLVQAVRPEHPDTGLVAATTGRAHVRKPPPRR